MGAAAGFDELACAPPGSTGSSCTCWRAASGSAVALIFRGHLATEREGDHAGRIDLKGAPIARTELREVLQIVKRAQKRVPV